MASPAPLGLSLGYRKGTQPSGLCLRAPALASPLLPADARRAERTALIVELARAKRPGETLADCAIRTLGRSPWGSPEPPPPARADRETSKRPGRLARGSPELAARRSTRNVARYAGPGGWALRQRQSATLATVYALKAGRPYGGYHPDDRLEVPDATPPRGAIRQVARRGVYREAGTLGAYLALGGNFRDVVADARRELVRIRHVGERPNANDNQAQEKVHKPRKTGKRVRRGTPERVEQCRKGAYASHAVRTPESYQRWVDSMKVSNALKSNEPAGGFHPSDVIVVVNLPPRPGPRLRARIEDYRAARTIYGYLQMGGQFHRVRRDVRKGLIRLEQGKGARASRK